RHPRILPDAVNDFERLRIRAAVVADRPLKRKVLREDAVREFFQKRRRRVVDGGNDREQFRVGRRSIFFLPRADARLDPLGIIDAAGAEQRRRRGRLTRCGGRLAEQSLHAAAHVADYPLARNRTAKAMLPALNQAGIRRRHATLFLDSCSIGECTSYTSPRMARYRSTSAVSTRRWSSRELS